MHVNVAESVRLIPAVASAQESATNASNIRKHVTDPTRKLRLIHGYPNLFASNRDANCKGPATRI